MGCMIVLIRQVQLWIIIKSRDCIYDYIVDPFYIDDLGGVLFQEYPPAGYSVGSQT
jgi:hypothetical protein